MMAAATTGMLFVAMFLILTGDNVEAVVEEKKDELEDLLNTRELNLFHRIYEAC